MKRLQKRRERPVASEEGLTPRRRFFKRIKASKKRFTPINAPHNTSEYLIENNSSPFFDDDNSEYECLQSSKILLADSEELFDDDSIFQRKLSATSTLADSYGSDSLTNEKSSIFTIK
jgi:hypothetical protein